MESDACMCLGRLCAVYIFKHLHVVNVYIHPVTYLFVFPFLQSSWLTIIWYL